jgi:threonine dehydrogenase-like Zn-dependent dehydrogenase
MNVNTIGLIRGIGIDCDYHPVDSELFADRKNVRVEKANLFYRNPTLKYIDHNIRDLKSTDVLIKVKKVGLCGSDYHCLEKNHEGMVLFSGPASFPQILGHEFVGSVEQIGKDVKNIHIGDYVACESVIWCGHCCNCRVGNFSECQNVELLGLTVTGALSEYIVVPNLHVWSINKLLNNYEKEKALTLGTLLEPLGCSYKALFQVSKYNTFIGSRAAVYGAGPIGLGAAWLLKTSGVNEIYIFDINKSRIKLAQAMGFENVVDVTNIDSISEFLNTNTKGEGIQISVECSGAGNDILAEIIRSTSAKGVIVYLSRTGVTQFDIDFDRIMSNSITIVGSRGHSGTFPYLINTLSKKENSYIFKMITKIIDFNDVIPFLKEKMYKEHGKVIVNI